VSGYRAAVSLSPVHTGDYMYSHRKRRLSPNLATSRQWGQGFSVQSRLH